MALLVCWALAPLLLVTLSIGCGALVELAGGRPLPGSLLVPSGFAVIVVVCDVATSSPRTAPLAVPTVIALAVAGLLAGDRRRLRPSPWTLGAVVFVYVAFGAPVLFSGQATFPGYIKLDDTATWFTLVDRALEHGRSLHGLNPSTYLRTLQGYLATGYPLGSFLPLAAVRRLLGWDVAWLVAPYLAFLGALLACALDGLLTRVLVSPARRALVIAVAAQPALLYGYAQWGGIKELFGAAMIPTAVALLPDAELDRGNVRALMPALVAAAAVLAGLSLGGVVWLAPVGGWFVLAFWRRARRGLSRRTAALTAATLVGAAAIVALSARGGFLDRELAGLRSNGDPGNLLHPLSGLQVLGVWPAGDFRVHPSAQTITHALLVAVVLGILAGAALGVRARAGRLLAYAAGTGLGVLVVALLANHWVTGKALAMGSPAATTLALGGVALLWQVGRRWESGVLATLIAAGVLWSNVLAYHDVNLAPRAQLAELQDIGLRIAGQGPTLMTEYQPYGVRHFLRAADAEGASELRFRPVTLLGGGSEPKSGYADLDQFELNAILVYRTLVLRDSPVESRPPSVYRLIWSGRYYQVWQRPAGNGANAGAAIVAHLPLGDALHAGAVPSCAAVLSLARLPGVRELVAPPRSESIVAPIVPQAGQAGDEVFPTKSFTYRTQVTVPASGRFRVWVGGSAKGRLAVSIDGRAVGAVHDQLQNAGQYLQIGPATLSAGAHVVTLRYSIGLLAPGGGGGEFPFGPLVLEPLPDLGAPLRVARAQARNLCGKALDWVEGLA